jgi:uncharacterized protein
MIVCDANVLLYAYDSRSVQHAPCRDWFAKALSGAESIGIPWQSLLAFIRISTNSRAYPSPLTTRRANDLVSSWLNRTQVVVPEPGARYWQILQAQLLSARVSGAMVTDAALAALALEQGAALCTTNRDFRRFDGLELIDPSAG